MSSPARIAILSNGHLCRNPRVLKEATTLAQAGYDVTVLTIRNHAPSEIVDQVLLGNAPFRLQAVDLLRGYQTSALAVLWRRVVTWAARRACRQLGLQSIHALGPATSLLNHARCLPADLFITHNEVPHWVGTRLIAEGRRVCADIEDWHSEDLLPAHRKGRPVALLRRIEAKLLHNAVHTTTTSEALANALHARYGGRRPLVLTNSFPLQPLPNLVPNAPPAFFWFSQTLGPGRGLEEFMVAWRGTAHPSRLVLIGTPTPGYVCHLLNLLPPERHTTVSFLPLVSPDELPALIARHDIGLALEQSTIPSRDLTITNKILQYLNAGLGIVATPTTGQREVLKQASNAGLLVNLHQAEEVTRQLDELLVDRARLYSMRSDARAAAEQHYCWEQETPRFLKCIKDALQTPAGHAAPSHS